MIKILVINPFEFEIPGFENEIDKNKFSITYVQIGYECSKLKAELSKDSFDFICCVPPSYKVENEKIELLKEFGVKGIITRSTGYDYIDIKSCEKNEIAVYNIPNYSRETIAEFAFSTLLSLAKKIHTSYTHSIVQNFQLEGLLGTTIHNKTIGVIGAGRIGQCFINIANGFGAKVIVYDEYLNKQPIGEKLSKQFNFEFVDFDHLIKESDFISIHANLMEGDIHLFNKDVFKSAKNNLIIVNTARGGFIKTEDLLEAIETNEIAGAAIDVYEFENNKFWFDCTENKKDELLTRLVNNPKILVTPHQAWFTDIALSQIYSMIFKNAENHLNNSNENRVV